MHSATKSMSGETRMKDKIDKEYLDGLKNGGDPPLFRYLSTSRNKEIFASVVYCTKGSNEGIVFYGAYYGYSGGAVNDGGFFRISKSENSDLDYDEVEKLGSSNPNLEKLYSFLMSKVWEPIANEDAAYPLELSAIGKTLMKKSHNWKGEGRFYMDDGFYGDELAEISEKWKIHLRFEK